MNCGRNNLPGLLLFLLLTCAIPAQADSPAFFLHDGDTVVFYGDSITEQQRYTRDVETYVVTRFPTWHVKFVNSGWNGDRVSGGEGGTIETRIKRDVLPYHPTVVTVLLGMNDAAYTHFDAAAFQTYTQGMTHIVDTLSAKLPGVRLTLLTPTYYDQYAPWSRHIPGYNEVLVKYGDFVKQIGADRHIPVVDLNAPMRAATKEGRKRDLHFTLATDGVHPTEAGQMIMAAALLQAWNAPGTVADVTLNPASPVSITAPLPWPLPDEARSGLSVSRLPRWLNVFQARAPHLTGKRWDLLVDGKPVGTFASTELQAGIDLSGLSAMPQNKQSAQVLTQVQDRIGRWRYLWKGTPDAVARPGDMPTDSETAALLAVDHWLDEARSSAHDAAQAQTHTYALRPAANLSLPTHRRHRP